MAPVVGEETSPVDVLVVVDVLVARCVEVGRVVRVAVGVGRFGSYVTGSAVANVRPA